MIDDFILDEDLAEDEHRRRSSYPKASFYQRDITWHEDAICASADPEIWFPEKGGSTKEAKRVCGRCVVRADCLEYAIDTGQRFGIWGSMSERDRRRLQRQLTNGADAA